MGYIMSRIPRGYSMEKHFVSGTPCTATVIYRAIKLYILRFLVTLNIIMFCILSNFTLSRNELIAYSQKCLCNESNRD